MEDLRQGIEELNRSIGASSPETVFAYRDQLERFVELARANPERLSDADLEGLARIARTSPFNDIHDPGSELHHRQTPAQDICLYTVRSLFDLVYRCPDKGAAIVGHLESLVKESLDYDIRNEAVINLWDLSLHTGKTADLAFEALERQGASNDCSYIRTNCRDNLLQTAKERPDMAPRAWNAQVGGADDPDAKARTRALAILTNRLKEKDCSYEEAESLMKHFTAAATKPGKKDEALQYWAENGIEAIQKRRLTDLVERGCSTRDDVQPLKPLKLKQPGG